MTIITTNPLSRSTDIVLELMQTCIQKGIMHCKDIYLSISHHHCDGSQDNLMPRRRKVPNYQ